MIIIPLNKLIIGLYIIFIIANCDITYLYFKLILNFQLMHGLKFKLNLRTIGPRLINVG